MKMALEEAHKAARMGEVPVGAVLVTEDRIFRGHNRVIAEADPTAHAEVVVLRQACREIGNYRLPQASLYVTLEPCLMCAGAIVQARVRRLVYGARPTPYQTLSRLSAQLTHNDAGLLDGLAATIAGVTEMHGGSPTPLAPSGACGSGSSISE